MKSGSIAVRLVRLGLKVVGIGRVCLVLNCIPLGDLYSVIFTQFPFTPMTAVRVFFERSGTERLAKGTVSS